MAGKSLLPTEGSTGGIQAGSPFTVPHYTFVQQSVPPLIASGRLNFATLVGGVYEADLVAADNGIVGTRSFTLANLDNVGLAIRSFNGASGNFTGGNAGNSLKGIIYYLVVSTA